MSRKYHRTARGAEAARVEADLADGHAHLAAGRNARAVEAFHRAAARAPENAAALEGLARAQQASGEALPALRTCDRIIRLGAASPSVLRLTGGILLALGEFAQAAAAWERALAGEPDSAEAHYGLGQACFELGETDRAARHMEKAALHSDSILPWQSLATIIPGCPAAGPERILEVRKGFAARLTPCGPATPPAPPPAPANRRLRIGYLSSFFHAENYMKPVWGVLNRHDRARFELHLFSDGPKPDMPGRVERRGDTLHRTENLSARDLARLIGVCRLDVLVDLNAYSAPNRLALFASRIAPVTVGWFNHFATSGLPGIDVLAGDAEVVPPGEERGYTEALERLPVSYLAFETTHAAPEVTPPPAQRTGCFTFGSLVTQYKITPPVLDAWAEILRRVPAARLLLANRAMKSPCNREYLLERFRDRAVDPERIVLLGPVDHLAFLRYYDRMDLALDAFPYNGGTTTMEALWQGVPVLTFHGDRWAARTSQTLLRHAELAEFVADSAEDYVARAIMWATDPRAASRLADLRHGMRPALRRSSACDTTRLARGLEDLYRRRARS